MDFDFHKPFPKSGPTFWIKKGVKQKSRILRDISDLQIRPYAAAFDPMYIRYIGNVSDASEIRYIEIYRFPLANKGRRGERLGITKT